MQPINDDRPVDEWSDDELLARYGKLAGEAGIESGVDDLIQTANIRSEIERRGLITKDESTTITEPVRWDGDGGNIDPSSGAVPNPPA